MSTAPTRTEVLHLLRARLDAVRPRSRDLRAMLRTPRGDVVAGVTVGVVALPLALAFGIASGLGATAGLVTAVVAGHGGGALRRKPRAGVRPDRCDDGGAGADRGRARAERRGRRGADGRGVARRDGPGGGRALRAFHPAAGHRGLHARHRGTDRAPTGACRPRHHWRARARRRLRGRRRARLVRRPGPRRPGAERRRGRDDPAGVPAAPRRSGRPAGRRGGHGGDAAGRPARWRPSVRCRRTCSPPACPR